MKAKSFKGSSTEEIEKALEQSLEDNYKPTLAFVFISIKQDIDRVCQLFDQRGIAIFGATSCNEFIDGEIESGSIVVLLLDMDPAHFFILFEDYRDQDVLALARSMATKAKDQFRNPVFLISLGIEVANAAGLGEPVLRAIEAVAGKDVVIWGGRAGDDFMFTESIVFTNQRYSKRGILLLVLDGDKIQVAGQAASGQISVGTEKTITKANDNWIYEIDNQPATDMIIKFLGLDLTPEEARTFLAPFILFSLSRDKGDPVMRSLGQFNWQTKAIVNLGNIKQGEKIRLTLPPDFEIVEVV
ncbi:MAG TPA: FIST N-terminal domain-containing protein, partial [Chitinophagaceae bacterium]|nr:FIST N-terminal domain-containing protein [Chitinophagaceae bacterium]